MKRSLCLAAAGALLVLGADAGAQQVSRPPKPPTVVKTPPVSTNTKIQSGAAAKVSPGGGPAIKGDAAIKGNAAIKGDAGTKFSPRDPAIKGSAAEKAAGAAGGAAIKGNSAITGNTISGGAIKGESALGGAGAKVSPGGGAIKGESAGVPAVQR